MKKTKGIYVELPIQTSMDRLWEYTQTPDLHEQWDVRFSTIEYLPKPDAYAPQKFLYSTHIGFGLKITGEGESTGNRQGTDGECTSALKFWSDERMSLIRMGSGYWKYIPSGDNIRFLTWYDYSVRFGKLGSIFDRWIFRPLIGRATAWSFACLRLWMEEGIPPSVSIRSSLMQVVIHIVLALIWVYQGFSSVLVSGIFPLLGVGAILFGLFFLIIRSQLLYYVNIIVLAIFGFALLGSQLEMFVTLLTPISLHLAMIGLSIVAIVNHRYVVTAKNCLRKPRRV